MEQNILLRWQREMCIAITLMFPKFSWISFSVRLQSLAAAADLEVHMLVGGVVVANRST